MNGYDRYLETDVATRSPLSIVIALYDGALRALGLARSSTDRFSLGRYACRANLIVGELAASLDEKAAPEMSSSLHRLYTTVSALIVDGSERGDPKPLEEAARILTVLRRGWASIPNASGSPDPRSRPPSRGGG